MPNVKVDLNREPIINEPFADNTGRFEKTDSAVRLSSWRAHRLVETSVVATNDVDY